MNVNQSTFASIEQVTGTYLNNINNSPKTQQAEIQFSDLLSRHVDMEKPGENTLKFSKHANQRLDSRNISLSSQQMERLQNGVKKAEQKGINESLVLMDSLAFIVNTKKNTVVTAMEQSETESNIYTNIDGAVII